MTEPIRWTKEQARNWAAVRPLRAGANYLPRTASNQLEMWQATHYRPDIIDEELGWAASLGFNSMRVFLHDLAWAQDPAGFLRRVDDYLSISWRHGIGTLFVFFDSCWHPFPHPGPQLEPEPGVHNSRWLQSPGVAVLRDAARFDALEGYVREVVAAFRDDERVDGWDVWNEPDNANTASRGPRDLGPDKARVVQPLMEKVFGWVRVERPIQPLTSAIWMGDWASDETMTPMERSQVEHSDIISFHNYGLPEHLEMKIVQLERYGRPLWCTEYMARGVQSTFENALPILRRHGVGAYNWGFVAGRSQTYYPWDSWQTPYPPEPPLWFHDIFRGDGTPYREDEVAFLRQTLKG